MSFGPPSSTERASLHRALDGVGVTRTSLHGAGGAGVCREQDRYAHMPRLVMAAGAVAPPATDSSSDDRDIRFAEQYSAAVVQGEGEGL